MSKVAACPHDGAVQEASSAEMTPRGSGIDWTADSSILSPGTRAGRGNLAHEKNVALAREIETMRQRLQAMGMCGGAFGAQAPTPALSAAPSLTPSVQASPAKPRATRTFNNVQRQREMAPPVFSLMSGSDVAKPVTQAGNRAEDASVAPGHTESAPEGNGQRRQLEARSPASVEPGSTLHLQVEASPTGDGGEGPSEAPDLEESKSAVIPHQEQRSLFDKMRSAGAVMAHQRAECGKASSGKTVYQALDDGPAPSLAGDTML